MKRRFSGFFALLMGLAFGAPAAVNLGTAANYGVLSSTFTRNGGASAITGDAGYTTLSGSGNHTVTGTNHVPSPPQAGLDQSSALANLNGMGCSVAFAPGAIDLASDTTHGSIGVYTPGVYCANGAMSIGGGGTITLIGKGIYVFRALGTLTTTNNSKVMLLGGAESGDVFWTPSQATTLGANTAFIGTVIDDADITVGSTTAWEGRALSFNGTVTVDTDVLSSPGSYIGLNPPSKGRFFVFPSPVKGDWLSVAYYMSENGRADVRLWNDNGDLVARMQEDKGSGPQKTRFPSAGFAPGVYLAKVVMTYDSGTVERTDVKKFTVSK
jgi:hypothetical protein